jgi:hypothetical protein
MSNKIDASAWSDVSNSTSLPDMARFNRYGELLQYLAVDPSRVNEIDSVSCPLHIVI